MKQTLFSLVAFALVAVSASRSPAPAAETSGAKGLGKPLSVVALRSYQELKDDLDYLGKEAGNPGLGRLAETPIMLLTNKQGLGGLDKSRPAGLIHSAFDDEVEWLAIIPVKDLDKLLESLSRVLGEPTDEGDGIQSVEGPSDTIYIKHRGEWAYFASSTDCFKGLPADPVSLLGGLTKKYDLAMRLIEPRNMPEEDFDALVERVQLLSETLLDTLPENSRAMAGLMLQQCLADADGPIKELHEVTIGLSIDAEAEKTLVDFSFDAIPGTQLAKMLAATEAGPSKFAAFADAKAAVSIHLNETVEAEASDETFVAYRAAALAALDKSTFRSPRDGEIARSLVTDLLDVAKDNVKRGQLNLGLLVTQIKGLPLAAGGVSVADGYKLEGIWKRVIELSRNEPKTAEAYKFELDAGEHKGVRFHNVQLLRANAPDADGKPKTDDNAGAEDAEDDAFSAPSQLPPGMDRITVGFGPQAIYMAAGKDARSSLSKLIDECASARPDSAAPLSVTFSAAPLIDIWAASDPTNPFTYLAKNLNLTMEDQILVTANHLPNGCSTRLEARKGSIKLVAMAALVISLRSQLQE